MTLEMEPLPPQFLPAPILREGLRLEAAGFDSMELKRGIDLAVEKAIEAVKGQSRAVKGKDQVTQVATIAANGDPFHWRDSG